MSGTHARSGGRSGEGMERAPIRGRSRHKRRMRRECRERCRAQRRTGPTNGRRGRVTMNRRAGHDTREHGAAQTPDTHSRGQATGAHIPRYDWSLRMAASKSFTCAAAAQGHTMLIMCCTSFVSDSSPAAAPLGAGKEGRRAQRSRISTNSQYVTTLCVPAARGVDACRCHPVSVAIREQRHGTRRGRTNLSLPRWERRRLVVARLEYVPKFLGRYRRRELDIPKQVVDGVPVYGRVVRNDSCPLVPAQQPQKRALEGRFRLQDGVEHAAGEEARELGVGVAARVVMQLLVDVVDQLIENLPRGRANA